MLRPTSHQSLRPISHRTLRDVTNASITSLPNSTTSYDSHSTTTFSKQICLFTAFHILHLTLAFVTKSYTALPRSKENLRDHHVVAFVNSKRRARQPHTALDGPCQSLLGPLLPPPSHSLPAAGTRLLIGMPLPPCCRRRRHTAGFPRERCQTRLGGRAPAPDGDIPRGSGADAVASGLGGDGPQGACAAGSGHGVASLVTSCGAIRYLTRGLSYGVSGGIERSSGWLCRRDVFEVG